MQQREKTEAEKKLEKLDASTAKARKRINWGMLSTLLSLVIIVVVSIIDVTSVLVAGVVAACVIGAVGLAVVLWSLFRVMNNDVKRTKLRMDTYWEGRRREIDRFEELLQRGSLSDIDKFFRNHGKR